MSGLPALLRESASLHLATAALFATLPPRMRSKHLAPKAERIARALERAADELEGRIDAVRTETSEDAAA